MAKKRSVLLESTQKNKKKRGKRKKTSKLSSFVSSFLVMLGLLIGAYPIVSNYYEYMEYQKVMDAQQTYVDYAQPEQLSDFLNAAYSYNENLAKGSIITDSSNEQAMQEYSSLLNVGGDGVMATITIPSISTKLPIYHGTTDEVLMHGVGHLVGTSLPVGGPSTHAVLTGHTGLPSARLFDSIDKLKDGDWFVITVMNQDLAYRVTSVETVLPDQTDSLAIQQGKDLVTLITCTPYGVNTHRLLVHAERCDIPQEWYDNNMCDGVQPTMETFLNTFDPYQAGTIVFGVAVVFFFLGRATARLRQRPPIELGLTLSGKTSADRRLSQINSDSSEQRRKRKRR